MRKTWLLLGALVIFVAVGIIWADSVFLAEDLFTGVEYLALSVAIAGGIICLAGYLLPEE